MILRAQPIGQPPSQRWVVQNTHNNTVWDGAKFVEDWTEGRKYAHPSDACGDMAEILKDFYGDLEKRTFVVPVEIEVYGSATKSKIARYLYQASVLHMRTEEYGNGPCECLALPTIHWGRIREASESAPSPDAENQAIESEESDADE